MDLNKPLTIVRDINELDAADGLVSRDITHQHEALDKDNEEVWLASHSTTPVSNWLSVKVPVRFPARVCCKHCPGILEYISYCSLKLYCIDCI